MADIDAAIARGEVAALEEALGPDFPNLDWPPGGGDPLLEYVIYHGPLSLVRALLERGADVNYESPAGFPSLIAALSGARDDRLAVAALLLGRGADAGLRTRIDECATAAEEAELLGKRKAVAALTG